MSFSRGGFIHWSVLLIVVLAAAAFGWTARKHPLWQRPLLRALGILLALLEIQWYIYCFGQGWVGGLPDLPLHLCDITLWLTVILLLRPSSELYGVVYYWALAGTTMALLMPDVEKGGLSYPVLHFFIAHGLVVAIIGGLAWGRVLRPNRGSWLKAWGWLNGYVVVVGLFNYFFKTNYLYLRQKPAQASLLDAMGPWPWYILAGDGLALLLFGAIYLPWRKFSSSL